MGSITQLAGLRSYDVAVDLGTTNTVVYVRGRGIVLAEPSLVALGSGTRKVRAVGIRAEHMLEHEPGSITPVRPLRRGVIADFDLAVQMLRRFAREACRGRRTPTRMVVVVPSGATSVTRQAVRDAGRSARAGATHLIDEPMAAAVGAGLPVAEAPGSLVVNIGGGTTEVALLSLGKIIVSRSIPVAGDELDLAIVRHMRRERGLLISERTAEEVKRTIGSTFPNAEDAEIEVDGRGAGSELPKTVVVTSEEIRAALEGRIRRIVEAVTDTLGRTPPQLAGEILERGTMLTGGGALLKGLADRLRGETQIPAQVAELPLTCVAAGAGKWLEELNDGTVQEDSDAGRYHGQVSIGY